MDFRAQPGPVHQARAGQRHQQRQRPARRALERVLGQIQMQADVDAICGSNSASEGASVRHMRGADHAADRGDAPQARQRQSGFVDAWVQARNRRCRRRCASGGPASATSGLLHEENRDTSGLLHRGRLRGGADAPGRGRAAGQPARASCRWWRTWSAGWSRSSSPLPATGCSRSVRSRRPCGGRPRRFFGVSAAGFAANEVAYALLLHWSSWRYDVVLALVLVARCSHHLLVEFALGVSGQPAALRDPADRPGTRHSTVVPLRAISVALARAG